MFRENKTISQLFGLSQNASIDIRASKGNN